jgi:hypothetical protein
MAEVLEQSALRHWQREPIRFIEEILTDPETGKPFELFPAEREFFQHAWQRNDDGRLRYTEQCFAAPKKSAKTQIAGMHMATAILVFGGRYAEGYCVANDLEQAQGRVFQAIRRMVETSPYLAREADITQRVITFPQTGATITAIGGDYASAAGANPTISSFDELWGYTSERSRRLFDELVPPPTRKIACRLTTTYAAFERESVLLEDIYKRGLKQPLIADDLRAGDGLLFFWSHKPLAPWQTQDWLDEMRRVLRPNQYLRMIENRFVTSEASFLPPGAWEKIENADLERFVNDPGLAVFVGVDASTKHDQTALVAVTFDHAAQQVRLVAHRVYQPSPDDPLDFEATIERTLLEWHERLCIVKVLFDPWQMQAVAQRLRQSRPTNRRVSAKSRQPNGGIPELVRTHHGAKSRCLSERSNAARHLACHCGRNTAAGASRKRNNPTRLTW